jgi:hypothetical protein
MNPATWIRSHVERCLQDVWNLPRVEVDVDGDYPFRWGTAACFVHIEEGDPVLVRVFAFAVVGARQTAKLLAELNDVNRRTRTASVYFSDGFVHVEQTLHVAGVDRETIAQACLAVGSVADDIGAMIANVHGGSTPFPLDSDSALDEEAC